MSFFDDDPRNPPPPPRRKRPRVESKRQRPELDELLDRWSDHMKTLADGIVALGVVGAFTAAEFVQMATQTEAAQELRVNAKETLGEIADTL